MNDPRVQKPAGQQNLDDAVSDLAGHFGLDFVGEMAKKIFSRIWDDPKKSREKLLETNRD